MISMDRFSSSAQVGLARLLDIRGSQVNPGTPTIGPAFHRIEDPQRAIEDDVSKAWDDPEIKRARKQLKRGCDKGVGFDPSGALTLDGRACCFQLIDGLNHGRAVIPEGEDKPVAGEPGHRWRCTCRALWECRLEVLK